MIDYLLKQALDAAKAGEALQRLLNLFEIAPVNRPVLEHALKSGIPDFEDAVLEQSGRLVIADVIVTSNTKDFAKSVVTVLDPAELLNVINSKV